MSEETKQQDGYLNAISRHDIIIMTKQLSRVRTLDAGGELAGPLEELFSDPLLQGAKEDEGTGHL